MTQTTDQEEIERLRQELRLIAAMVDAPTDQLAYDLYTQARRIAKDAVNE